MSNDTTRKQLELAASALDKLKNAASADWAQTLIGEAHARMALASMLPEDTEPRDGFPWARLEALEAALQRKDTMIVRVRQLAWDKVYGPTSGLAEAILAVTDRA